MSSQEENAPTRTELQKTVDAGKAAQATLDALIAQEGLTLTDVLDGFAEGKAYRHREWPEGFFIICSEWQLNAPPPYGTAIISYTILLHAPCSMPAFEDTIILRGGREKIEASMRCLFAQETGWEEVKKTIGPVDLDVRMSGGTVRPESFILQKQEKGLTIKLPPGSLRLQAVSTPPPMIAFTSPGGAETATLNWEDGQLVFKGSADEAARIFFERVSAFLEEHVEWEIERRMKEKKA